MDSLIKIQNRLVEAQIEIVKLMEKQELEKLKLGDGNPNAKHEMIGDVLKITIPEYPPKLSIYQKIEFVDGKIASSAYQKARSRWYSIIQQALKNYKGGRIDPAIIYIVYYVPRICDVGNFVSKMIIDGLMYAGAIAKDDNLKHVPVEIKEARIDKENPRTEIYVIKYTNQIEEILTPWVKRNREKSRVNL